MVTQTLPDGTALAGEVTDLLSHLIRNACVNDGRAESGDEHRSVDVLRQYLTADSAGRGMDVEIFEPTPGRQSLVARIEGRRADAPTLMLMGHTDVVPVSPEGWQRDPFGGEVVDGEVWGRGAVDMLNLTSSMAVAFKHLAEAGFRPDGTLIYLAVADEEAGGDHGAKHLVEHELDAVRADYMITESGGIVTRTPSGPKVTVHVGEKGAHWVRLHVAGTPGHGSRPLRTDNALVKAARIVDRFASHHPKAQIGDVWRRFVDGMEFPPAIRDEVLDPDRVWDFVHESPRLQLARHAHACTHTTISPNVIHGGVKTNVIPDQVAIDVDIRTLPGQTEAEIDTMIAEIIGPDLVGDVRVELIHYSEPSSSPMDTPLWDALAGVTQRLVPGAALIPGLIVGGTDARFFRAAGTVSYGFGLFSERLTSDRYASMFHGHDERIDVDSLALTTDLWLNLAPSLLGGR